MSILITSDIHMSEVKRDEHRWGLFPWIRDQVGRYDVNTILILGDLTDTKDRHSSTLVNRLVHELCYTAEMVDQFIILMGNHDCIDPAYPFFGFIGEVTGKIVFVNEILDTFLADDDKNRKKQPALFLANTKNWRSDWNGLDFNKYSWIFTHQTYAGMVTESGFVLDGIPPAVFAKTKAKVWSGDIHGPQKVSPNIEYVGSPYRTRFGDDMIGRVVLLRDGKQQDLHFPCKNKHVVDWDIKEDQDWSYIKPGDQVKVRVHLRRMDLSEWPALRDQVVQWAKGVGVELFGPEPVMEDDGERKQGSLIQAGRIEPEAVVKSYCKTKRTGRILEQIGLELLK